MKNLESQNSDSTNANSDQLRHINVKVESSWSGPILIVPEETD